MRETFFLIRAFAQASLMSPTTPCSLEKKRKGLDEMGHTTKLKMFDQKRTSNTTSYEN